MLHRCGRGRRGAWKPIKQTSLYTYLQPSGFKKWIPTTDRILLCKPFPTTAGICCKFEGRFGINGSSKSWLFHIFLSFSYLFRPFFQLKKQRELRKIRFSTICRSKGNSSTVGIQFLNQWHVELIFFRLLHAYVLAA